MKSNHATNIDLEFKDPRGQNCEHYGQENGICVPLAIGCLRCQVYPVRQQNRIPDFGQEGLGFVSGLVGLQAYASAALFSVFNDTASNHLKLLYLQKRITARTGVAMARLFNFEQQQYIAVGLDYRYITVGMLDRLAAFCWRYTLTETEPTFIEEFHALNDFHEILIIRVLHEWLTECPPLNQIG